MPITYIGAGAGTVITTGTGTVTKTGCTYNNLLLCHAYEDGVTFQLTRSNGVNIKFLNGVINGVNFYQSAVSVGVAQVGNHSILVGRAMADGTCSLDLTVGAAGADISARFYEFSGVNSQGAAISGIGENVGGSAGGQYRSTTATNTTPGDAAVVTGRDNDLALSFLVIQGAQAVGDFTGETGGDWVEAEAEYTHATGSGVTMQLQTAAIATAGTTIDGGTMTITSAPWGVMSFALIPDTYAPTWTYPPIKFGPF